MMANAAKWRSRSRSKQQPSQPAVCCLPRLALLAAWCALAALPLSAQPTSRTQQPLPSILQEPNGFVVDVPNDSSFSQHHGLRLHVDSRWLNNFGYRPIRIRVDAKQPTTLEHHITLRLFVTSWQQTAGNLVVEQDLVLPLGATSTETVLSCPQFESAQRYWWQVWIDSQLDRELGVSQTLAWQLNGIGNIDTSNTSLKFLIIDPHAKQQQMLSLGADIFEALVVPLAELPDRWRDYSAIDVVVASPDHLDTLAKSQPAALLALRRWNRAGGQLWIPSVGDHWERLADVEKMLDLPTFDFLQVGGAAANKPSKNSETPLGWAAIQFVSDTGEDSYATFRDLASGSRRTTSNPAEIAELKQNRDYVLVQDAILPAAREPLAASREKFPTDSAKWYIQRPLGLGLVRAYCGEWDPVGFGISWRMLLGATPPDLWSMPTPLTAAIESSRTWESRYGMTPGTANEDFADFLVPGVGLAPVTEFRVLITLFVLVIGPLNYWVLKRSNRLHLLLLTVPLFAFTLTGGLFAYAIVSDGLSTSVRVRSFTTLDQRTGEAACWSRLSYYASLAPQSGFDLPADVTLYPIIAGWDMSASGDSLAAERQLLWSDETQALTGGWLRSRTPTQYLSVRARQSPHRLQIDLQPPPSTATQNHAETFHLQITNELGAAIQYVTLVDDSGNMFCGDTIPDRATVTLQPSSHAVALRRLRKLVSENQPELPPALKISREYTSGSQRSRQRRFQRNQFGREHSSARLGQNLLNDAIAALVATTPKTVLNLPPRSYVAITTTGPEVELGIRAAEEVASFHVLFGQW